VPVAHLVSQVALTDVANETAMAMQHTPPSQSAASLQCTSLCVHTVPVGSHVPVDPLTFWQQKLVPAVHVEAPQEICPGSQGRPPSGALQLGGPASGLAASPTAASPASTTPPPPFDASSPVRGWASPAPHVHAPKLWPSALQTWAPTAAEPGQVH